jgi:hypothetical protein
VRITRVGHIWEAIIYDVYEIDSQSLPDNVQPNSGFTVEKVLTAD